MPAMVGYLNHWATAALATVRRVRRQLRCRPYHLTVIVVKVTDSCHEFEPSATEDKLCKEAIHVITVEAQTSFRWHGVFFLEKWCQLRCHSRLLTVVQNDEVRRQKPSSR
ncbi:hypothetical protein TNCV_287981 [Trichonephila clavipes]|nr:hypothetical protein TNCV_287981 [Trichonephila clavipes]